VSRGLLFGAYRPSCRNPRILPVEDTDAKLGLYDDFLFTRLGYTNAHQNVYVSLSFKE
jgi:hypothetical protein